MGLDNSRSSRHIQQTLIAEEFSEFVEAARQIYDKNSTGMMRTALKN